MKCSLPLSIMGLRDLRVRQPKVNVTIYSGISFSYTTRLRTYHKVSYVERFVRPLFYTGVASGNADGKSGLVVVDGAKWDKPHHPLGVRKVNRLTNS